MIWLISTMIIIRTSKIIKIIKINTTLTQTSFREMNTKMSIQIPSTESIDIVFGLTFMITFDLKC